MYFSGKLEKERIVKAFTPVKLSQPNFEIFDVLDAFSQKIFIDKRKKIYDWTERKYLDEEQMIESSFCDASKMIESFFNDGDSGENKKSDDIIDIKLTKYQMFILTENHDVSSLQIKIEEKNISYSLITRSLFPNPQIRKISCGSSHCLALSEQGTVFSWGSNANGRLGQGKKSDVNEPTIMYHLLSYNIVDIASGVAHNLALGIDKKTLNANSNKGFTRLDNSLLAWGSGSYGCLGNGTTEDQYIPMKIDFFDDKKVREAYCGFTHSCVLTYEGKLYTFGDNEYGQLGCSDSTENNDPFTPKLVNLEDTDANQSNSTFSYYHHENINMDYVDKVYVGPFHMMALSNNGQLYSWGLGSYGQLANQKLDVKQQVPKPVIFADHTDFAENGKSYRKVSKSSNIILNMDASYLFLIPIENQIAVKELNGQETVKTEKTDENGENSVNISFTNKAIDKMNSIFFEFNTIFASRPKNLPPKDKQEEQEHRKMIELQKKTFLKKFREEEQKKIKNKEKNESKYNKNKQEWANEVIPKWKERKNSEQVKYLAYMGIPTSLRSKVWTMMIYNRLSLSKEYFEVFLAKGRSLSDKYQEYKKMMKESKENVSFASLNQDDPLHSKLSKESTIKMIEADLPRTFPLLPIFNSDSPVFANLKDLLQAFACSRPEIGYVQGMSYVAGLLLLYLDTFDAFVCFSNLITQPFLLEFFKLEERPITACLDIFGLVFKINLPELHNHFELETLNPKMYIFEWILTIYSKALNLDFVSRIWDVFFLEGPIILYKTGLAILKLLEESLMKEDLLGMMKILKNLSDHIKNEDELLNTIKKVSIPAWIVEKIANYC